MKIDTQMAKFSVTSEVENKIVSKTVLGKDLANYLNINDAIGIICIVETKGHYENNGILIFPR